MTSATFARFYPDIQQIFCCQSQLKIKSQYAPTPKAVSTYYDFGTILQQRIKTLRILNHAFFSISLNIFRIGPPEARMSTGHGVWYGRDVTSCNTVTFIRLNLIIGAVAASRPVTAQH